MASTLTGREISMATRYNCYWIVSFLPTRIEVVVNSRDSNVTLFEDLRAELDCNFDAVEKFLDKIGVTIFNYECFKHTVSTNYLGKGVFSEIFSEQSVRDVV